MHAGIDGPCRDVAPCKGCARKEKKPGCHDRCKDYKDWKTREMLAGMVVAEKPEEQAAQMRMEGL